MNGRRMVAGAALLLASACAEATGIDDPGSSGLRFDLSGSLGGSFQALGEPSIANNGLPGFGEWAVARADSLGGLVIAGFDPINGSVGNLFILQLNTRQPGTYGCSLHGETGCHGRIFTGVDPTNLTVQGTSYHVTAGSVAIDEVNSRVKGSMSLTLQAANGSGGLDPDDTLTLTSGVLDVPYSQDVVVSNGIACMARNLAEKTNRTC